MAKLGDQHSSENKSNPSLPPGGKQRKLSLVTGTSGGGGGSTTGTQTKADAYGTGGTGGGGRQRHAPGRWSDNFLCSVQQMFLFRFFIFSVACQLFFRLFYHVLLPVLFSFILFLLFPHALFTWERVSQLRQVAICKSNKELSANVKKPREKEQEEMLTAAEDVEWRTTHQYGFHVPQGADGCGKKWKVEFKKALI